MTAPVDSLPPAAVLVKGWPRLSETFIAQEVLELERRGFALAIWSLRRPHDGAVHPMHRAVRAPVTYLPEYLREEPGRVARAALAALARPMLLPLLALFARDLARDPTLNRLRRLGQCLVLARELDPAVRHLHVHYLHTPASVARYAARLTGRSYSVSAHAKDIWTTPDWELREKLRDAAWCVTCTRDGHAALARLAEDPAKVALVHHGLDPARVPPAPTSRPPRDGRDPGDPVRLVTVGRAVAKKGFADLLDAVASLPADLAWRLAHVGSGPLLAELRTRADSLGLAKRVEWRGALAGEGVFAALAEADLFALACRPGPDGDRDGLPNVVLEAASQGLPVVSTRFAGVPEFVTHGTHGLLVPSADPPALSAALAELIRDPARRAAMGESGQRRARRGFSFSAGVDAIEAKLAASLGAGT